MTNHYFRLPFWGSSFFTLQYLLGKDPLLDRPHSVEADDYVTQPFSSRELVTLIK